MVFRFNKRGNIKKYVLKLVHKFKKSKLLNFLSSIILSPLKTTFNIFLGFLAFILLSKIYPYIPYFGGVHRSDFAAQQLTDTINEYSQGYEPKIYELDFLGFGEKGYLLIIDKSKRDYSENYRTYKIKGNVEIVLLQEAQQNSIEKFIFSNKIYKKAFGASFENSELTYDQPLQVEGIKDRFIFCINKNICGFLRYKNKFQIEPITLSGDFSCTDKINKDGYELSKIRSAENVAPVLFYKKKTSSLFIAYPTDEKENGTWQRSSEYQFCAYHYPDTNFNDCYITKDRYGEGGINTVSGDLKDYFDAETNYHDKLLFEELSPCKSSE